MSDDSFIRNVREARENGFDLVCALCGLGMQDEDFEDADAHEYDCPNRGRDRHVEYMAMIEQRLGRKLP